jgi:hypothetical protein
MEVINKYNTAKIYTIRSNSTDKYYIGATTCSLAQRLGQHKAQLKMHLKGNGSRCSSFEILKHPDAYIELLENINCNNKEELNKREGELQREHINNLINTKMEGRTRTEYYNDNIEQITAHKETKKRCDICDRSYRIDNWVHHAKTKKHLSRTNVNESTNIVL